MIRPMTVTMVTLMVATTMIMLGQLARSPMGRVGRGRDWSSMRLARVQGASRTQ